MSNSCYPLPNPFEVLPLPLFKDSQEYELKAEEAWKVPDEYYALWTAEFAQQNSLAGLLNVDELGDLERLNDLLERAHRNIHHSLEEFAKDPGSLVTGTYLSLCIYHAGVERLLDQVGSTINNLRGWASIFDKNKVKPQE